MLGGVCCAVLFCVGVVGGGLRCLLCVRCVLLRVLLPAGGGRRAAVGGWLAAAACWAHPKFRKLWPRRLISQKAKVAEGLLDLLDLVGLSVAIKKWPGFQHVFCSPSLQKQPQQPHFRADAALARGAPLRQKPWGGPGLGTTVGAATLRGRAREGLPSSRQARACEGAHHRASAHEVRSPPFKNVRPAPPPPS
eukprot:COSAG01_NODE_1735_length_9365_cov_3.816318_8_plen_193_part_00